MVNPENVSITFRIPFSGVGEVIDLFQKCAMSGDAGDFMPVLEMIITRGYVTAWNLEDAAGNTLAVEVESLGKMEFSHTLMLIRRLRQKLTGSDLPN